MRRGWLAVRRQGQVTPAFGRFNGPLRLSQLHRIRRFKLAAQFDVLGLLLHALFRDIDISIWHIESHIIVGGLLLCRLRGNRIVLMRHTYLLKFSFRNGLFLTARVHASFRLFAA